VRLNGGKSAGMNEHPKGVRIPHPEERSLKQKSRDGAPKGDALFAV
jgi:hypothetical protein